MRAAYHTHKHYLRGLGRMITFKTHKNTVELGNKALAAVGIQRWAKLDALVGLVPLHSDYDFFGLGLAEGSGLWVGAAHFGASFVGCEHPFDASA